MNIFLMLFIVMPIVEMLILIEVGSLIGAFYTILLVLLTAMIGVSLLKKQGLSTLLRANQKLNEGQVPLSEIGEGMLLAMAGALLLTPGFVTDIIGFVFLTPGLRQQIAKVVAEQLVKRSAQSSSYSYYEFHSRTSGEPFSTASRQQDDVIDGEFEEVRDKQEKINLKKD